MINFIKVEIFFENTPFTPPVFLGSMLRGAFGVSLKKVVCINPSYKCDGCFAKENCLFYEFFEQKNSFHPFRFDVKLYPENFDFGFYLFENATDKLPYILSTFHKMLTEQGLGVNRETIQIKEIRCNDQVVYNGRSFDLGNVFEEEFEEGEFHSDIKLLFITPLRMKYQNRLLREKPKLDFLLQSIYNRYRELKKFDKKKLPFDPSYEESSSSVYFKDLTRYSNRQKTKMQIGGILGEIEYKGIDKESFRLLKLGELIGAGKQTVFGMGKIRVEEKK